MQIFTDQYMLCNSWSSWKQQKFWRFNSTELHVLTQFVYVIHQIKKKKKKKSYSAAGDNRLINQVKVLYGLFMWETESGRIKEFIHFFFILCACGTFFEIDADNVF